MLRRLAHYSVRCTDLESSRIFYTGVLGLRAGPRPPFGFPGLWLYLNDDEDDQGQGCVHLIGSGDALALTDYLGERSVSMSVAAGPLDHIAFFAENWPLCQARLDDRGVPYTERRVPQIGIRQVFLVDPDGVVIELNFLDSGSTERVSTHQVAAAE